MRTNKDIPKTELFEKEGEYYTTYCNVLNRNVVLDWYAKYCDCGSKIIGAPEV